VVRHCGPGQFVIVRVTTDGERIPLTIAHADKTAKTITLVVQAVGMTTKRMCALETGESLADVVGPLGKTTHIEHVGHAVIVGGGVGTAVIYPQAGALKAKGNRVTAIIGGRSKPYVILENELGVACDAVHPCTDDGSYGFHGFVTQRLQKLIEDEGKPGLVLCGGCRVQVDGQMLFACVDGPEFDAHQVDFRELSDRLTAYREQERTALERHTCRLTGAVVGGPRQ
jgi:ferredoxin--NADP+ reductase